MVRYGRIGRALSDNEIAGAVAPARRAALALEWRQAVAEDAGIKARHLMAQEMVFETCLQEQAAAAAEAARLLAIYGARRDIGRIRVDITNLDYRTDRTKSDPFASQHRQHRQHHAHQHPLQRHRHRGRLRRLRGPDPAPGVVVALTRADGVTLSAEL
ncbi:MULTISPECIES: hypothetical protein [unclassified Methylobacterium]|uniref:hypothetical protein n=1 Tax=unclassified Methylobacterium TaxID=2615210 RepID=UPI0036FF4D42